MIPTRTRNASLANLMDWWIAAHRFSSASCSYSFLLNLDACAASLLTLTIRPSRRFVRFSVLSPSDIDPLPSILRSAPISHPRSGTPRHSICLPSVHSSISNGGESKSHGAS